VDRILNLTGSLSGIILGGTRIDILDKLFDVSKIKKLYNYKDLANFEQWSIDFIFFSSGSVYSKLDVEHLFDLVMPGGLVCGLKPEGTLDRLHLGIATFGVSVIKVKKFDLWFTVQKGLLRPSLQTLLGKNDLVGAEIGTYLGDNSLSMLKQLNIAKLYLIDPYDKVVGSAGVKNVDLVVEKAKRKLKNFKNIVWINKFSSEAIEDIKDELDFVYIDGNHEYEFVKKDIELYSDKLKPGGLLAGHDFELEDTPKPNGVSRAVEEFTLKNGLRFNVKRDPNCLIDKEDTNDWWIII